jgi:molecular chaperone GrpE (heat shock protein)
MAEHQPRNAGYVDEDPLASPGALETPPESPAEPFSERGPEPDQGEPPAVPRPDERPGAGTAGQTPVEQTPDGQTPVEQTPVDEIQPPSPENPPAAATVPVELIRALEQRLEEALRLAQHRDELVDRLHAENRQLREGELRSALLPLLRDLMRLHDDLDRITAVDPDANDAALVRDAITDTLARNGVSSFAPLPADPFDSSRHAAVGTDLTKDQRIDRTIATVRRAGFRHDDGSIVRAADVTVYKYKPAPEGEPAATDPGEQEPASSTEPATDDERN